MTVDVGGQETLLISCILGKLATGAGYDVKPSEAHDMIQRGGNVVTLVYYREKVSEPIVEEGQVDMLIAFKRLEALRHLYFLKKDRAVIVNDRRIDPITVATGVASHPKSVPGTSKEIRKTIVVEATAEAKKLGAPKAFNIIVPGAATRYMGFKRQDWLSVIEITAPSKTIEMNKQAPEIGYALSP